MAKMINCDYISAEVREFKKENKTVKQKENTLSTKKATKKKSKNDKVIKKKKLSFLPDRFLGRERVFFFVFSYFLGFFL